MITANELLARRGQPNRPTPATVSAGSNGASSIASLFDFSGNGRPVFKAPRLARALIAEAPVAVGGEALHRYRDGAYRPDGERWARRRITEVLGDDYTRSRADEVVAFMRDG